MDYSSLGIKEEIRQAIDKMGFTELTEVQEKAIPPMLAGRDVVAKAPTGTGKTCAFGVPLIQDIDPALAKPQAMVLCPTRELCLQITEELGSLTAFLPDIRIAAVYGGQPIEKQIRRLKEGAQIVVATPGRMQDHMDHRTIDVRGIATVVLDEADEMLDMGFYRDVMKIVDHLPARQHLHMFSATISREVMDISWKYQKEPGGDHGRAGGGERAPDRPVQPAHHRPQQAGGYDRDHGRDGYTGRWCSATPNTPPRRSATSSSASISRPSA